MKQSTFFIIIIASGFSSVAILRRPDYDTADYLAAFTYGFFTALFAIIAYTKAIKKRHKTL